MSLRPPIAADVCFHDLVSSPHSSSPLQKIICCGRQAAEGSLLPGAACNTCDCGRASGTEVRLQEHNPDTSELAGDTKPLRN